MELKRGWWKQNDGGHSFLAGELNGVWYGVDSDHELNSWNADADGLSSQAYDIPGFTLTGIYCGDGPEPVEPVQQPDPRDAEIERLKAENEKLQSFKTAYMEWSDKTDWIQNKKDLPAKYLGWHLADVLKAEIERLTGDISENKDAVIMLAKDLSDMRHQRNQLQKECNRLTRIIGDH